MGTFGMNSRDRKSSLKALFGEPLVAAPETKSLLTAVNKDAAGDGSPSAEPAAPARATSGAVKAMGLSLSSITREAEEAKLLRQAMEAGERVVALEAGLVDASFVSDRLSDEDRDDPDFLALVESMRESGQQAPILVRPHPAEPGRYQVAYGHRRLKAARRLGQSVRALVRPLTDEELVVAQGKENAERRNLSFIERAVFARALVERGFDRKLVGEALAVQKSELSRLLQVADGVPDQFVRAIGPAPKAGRARWIALAALFGNDAASMKAVDEAGSERFRKATSDERFRMLFERLARRTRPEKTPAEALEGPDGRVFARISRAGKGIRIDFAADIDPAFAEVLAERLRDDYARFLADAGDS
jgi:ParB family chromosome partitioning protein